MGGVAADHDHLQRQLYVLGYSLELPPNSELVVSTLLKDMQTALSRVKELEEANTKLEREERTSRAGSEKYKGELLSLRTENNKLRADVLNYVRDLDGIRREARGEAYKLTKQIDDLRMANLKAKAENAETLRKLDEARARLEAEVSRQDSVGLISSRITISQPLDAATRGVGGRRRRAPPPAVVELVDLSSRRIGALEEEVNTLETKLNNASSQLRATQLEIQERDLEIARLNAEYEKLGSSSSGRLNATNLKGDAEGGHGYAGSDPVARLSDQVDYLQERSEKLEKESEELRRQLAREKEELHRRWVSTENERVRLSEQIKDMEANPRPATQPNGNGRSSPASGFKQALQGIKDLVVQLMRAVPLGSGASSDKQSARVLLDQLYDECQALLSSQPNANATASGSGEPPLKRPLHNRDLPGDLEEVEHLRIECANIKSLYVQTRDQLQDLLKSGNTEAKRDKEQAKKTELALRKELDDLRAKNQDTVQKLEADVRQLKEQLARAPEHAQLAKDREKQVARLEKKVARLTSALENEQDSQAKRVGELTAELKDAQEKFRRLRETADERQEQYDSLLAEYHELIGHHKKLDRSLKQAVGEVAEWRAKADERDHKLSDIGRRLEEARLQHRQSSTELRACKRTLDNYTSDLETLRESHANDQREMDRLNEELEQVGRLKRAIEMSKDDYKRQLAKSLGESESHRSLIAHLQAERNALRVQVKAQFHLSQRLEQRLETLDPNYLDDTLRASTSSSLSSASTPSPLPTARLRAGGARRHQMLSRSSSAAHSARSFEDLAASNPRPAARSDNGVHVDVEEAESTSSISMP